MTDQNVDFITEPVRQTPVAAKVDVAVVGGGVSGIVAAVASARNGAETILIERYAYLGGYFDSGPGGQSVGISFQDMNGNIVIKGIAWEIMERLIATGGAVGPKDMEVPKDKELPLHVSYGHARQARHIGKTKPHVDYEAVRTLAFEMMEEEGVKLLLHSWTVGAIVESNVMKGVIVENKSGRQAILAKVVIDCTGDADVAAYAGAPFEKSPKQEMYQISRNFKIAVRNDKGQTVIVGGAGGSYDYGDGTDVWDLTKAEIEIRKKAVEHVTQMRKRPGYENCFISGDGHPPQLGVRETRRIIGEYMLTEDDMVEGRKFPDTITKSASPIDMHKSGGENENRSVKTDYYDIPYRCLVPKKIDNLLVAGRCISATHIAEAGIRKIPVCMATGQAAGTAAALAAKSGVSTRALDVNLLQKTLREQGACV